MLNPHPAFLERDRKYQYDKYHKYKDVYKQIRDLGKEAYAGNGLI